MNAQSIWAGEHYAWAYMRPKSDFPRNGKEVVAIATRRIRQFGNERLSTEVHVRVVDSDKERWVPAREIVDFWDNYEQELLHVLESEEAARKAREDKRKEEAAAHEKQYTDYAELTGIPRIAIRTLYATNVTIDREALERRLGVLQNANGNTD
jgi:uncharacterized damage-inducible protein DinB